MTTIGICLNGELRQVASANVAAMLAELGLAGQRVAVELNGTVVPRGEHAQRGLTDGDRVEVVAFVGGG